MNNSNKNNAIIGILVGLLFFAIGAYLIWTDYSALSWVQVKGVITASKIDRITDSQGTLYRPNIEYNYTYNRKQYGGTCCKISTSDYTEIAKITDKNSPKSEIDVLVNQNDPYLSRLKEDVQPFSWFYLIVTGTGALVLVVGILQLFKNSNS